MCVTVLGVTICIRKAEPKVPANWQYDPMRMLEEARYKALMIQVTRRRG